MNKLNNIFKMVSQLEKNANEVKLAQHEVELGAMQDLDKLIGLGADESQKSFELTFKVKGLLTEIISVEKFAIAKYNDALKKAESVYIQVKDLGLDVPQGQIKSKIDMINFQLKKRNENIKSIDQALKSL